MKRSDALKTKSRALRSNSTDAERLLWLHLRRRQLAGFRFRRQHPIGDFIADFVCLERSLVVEVDGGQHQTNGAYDTRRSEQMGKSGFRVVRFWNNQVFQELDAVKETILKELGGPHPNPPPTQGRRTTKGTLPKGKVGPPPNPMSLPPRSPFPPGGRLGRGPPPR